jgi:hypothetical protein
MISKVIPHEGYLLGVYQFGKKKWRLFTGYLGSIFKVVMAAYNSNPRQWQFIFESK